MRNLTSDVRRQQIEWRRTKVLELTSAGYNQTEICQKLQIDKSAVNRDIQFLKQEAQNKLRQHISKVVPMEYERCITGMKRNLKQTLEIAETAADPRTKLQARAIANDCYKYIMDLVTNGVIVTDALSYVNGKAEKLSEIAKSDKKIFVEIEPTQEDKTTNNVF